MILKTYEKVITGHSWLTGDTSRDNDNVTILQGLLRSVVGGEESCDLGRGSNVGQVGSDLIVSLNTRYVLPAYSDGVDDIVEGELGDQRVELEEEGEGLTDST